MAGNLYRRGKTWWARTTIAGREYRGSLSTSHRAQAVKDLPGWLAKRGRSKVRGLKRLMWAEAVTIYTAGALADLGERTAERYKVSLRQVDPFFEGLFVDEIGTAKINDLVRRRRETGVTNATINRDLTAISRVLATAVREEAIEENVARNYDRSFNREKRDPIELPTWGEVAEAIKKAPTALWGQIMDYASKSGMRENEILTLEKKRVDLPRLAVTLHRTKGKRLRVVPLTGPVLNEAVPILEAAMTRGESLVFGHKDDDTLKNFPSRYAVWRKKHGVAFRFHDLRHLFAVTYLQRGGNIYDLQRILGHRSIKTTEGYLEYLTPAERRKATIESAQTLAQS